MTITVHDQFSTALQCLPDTAFKKRTFYPAALVMSFYQKQANGLMSCEERLAQAEIAFHNLTTGAGVQYIHHDGQTLHYTPANRDDLWRYVMTLRAQCGEGATDCLPGCACGSCAGLPRSKGRAMGVGSY